MTIGNHRHTALTFPFVLFSLRARTLNFAVQRGETDLKEREDFGTGWGQGPGEPSAKERAVGPGGAGSRTFEQLLSQITTRVLHLDPYAFMPFQCLSIHF